MSNPSRPARTRYPFLLPKADSLNKISTAITLDPDWKVSRKLSLWIKPELLQACKVHSPKQKAKTGISATVKKEVLASWSLIRDVLKFWEVLEVPLFSPWASQDVASHVDGRSFVWVELLILNMGENYSQLPYATYMLITTWCEKSQKFFPGDGCSYKRD